MKRRVNGTAVLILLGGLVALTVGAHCLHAYQLRRNAGAVYAQALLAEQEENLAQAADYLEQYLGLAPGDNEALARLGALLDRQAKTPRALARVFFMLEQVLRREPDRSDIRRRVARIATKLGRPGDAAIHLERLLKETPDDPELLQLMGWCAIGKSQYDEADEWYRKALKLAPDRVDLAVEYAALLRNRLEMPAIADARIEAMVRANDQSPEARLQGAQYYGRYGLWEQAEKHVQFVLEKLRREDAEVLLLAAGVARARGKDAEARKHLERGRQLYPQDTRLMQALAQQELRDGDRAKARRYLEASVNRLPPDRDQLWALAGLCLEAGDLERADIIARRLGQLGAAVHMGCVHAQILMQRESWGEARVLLDRLPTARQSRDVARLVPLLLGLCYDRLANPDQRLHACQRAVDADPNWPIARRSLALSCLALGKTDRALAELRKAAAQAPPLRAELVQLLIAHNERLPAAQQHWQEVETLLSDLTPAGEPVTETQVLRAQALAAQGKRDEARKLMEAERRRDPKHITPWLMLAGLALQPGKEDAVPALLDEAERQAGRRVEWYVARARHWSRTRGPAAAERLQDLQASLEQFTGNDRSRLLRALAEAFDRRGDTAASDPLWRRLAEAQPHDLAVRLLLLERALGPGQQAEAERLVAEIRKIEGDGGAAAALGEAACLIVHTQGNDSQRLTAARKLLARAAELRPSWSRVPLLEAMAYDQENRRDLAVEKYQLALSRGETRLFATRRLLQLLYEQGRYAEAQALVRKLPEPALAQRNLGQIASVLALTLTRAGDGEAGGRDEALRLARNAAAANPKEYRDHLWLGQIAAVVGQHEEAEQAFRRARDLADTELATWAALILYLAPRDVRKAEAELTAAAAKLGPDRLPLLRAAACEALGRLDQAEQAYLSSAAAQPGEPAGLFRTAAFYLRSNQPAKAEPWLRQLIEPKRAVPQATVTWARRELALVLAYRATYAAFKEATALLDANAAPGGADIRDRRARAIVLATQPAHRREAIALLEKLPGQATTGSLVSQVLLTQLYETDNNWRRARTLLTDLLREHDKNPVLVARFARGLLRHKEIDAAEALVAKLVELAPDAFETIELRARVLKERGKIGEAANLVKTYARQQGARHAPAAALLEQLGLHDDAEVLYRSIAAAAKQPEAMLTLAQHLSRRHLPEALALCEQAWRTCPPEKVAVASVIVAHGGHATDDQLERVQGWITAALAKDATSPTLWVAYGDLQNARGRHAEALAHYRRALERSPANVLALNNLAYLLVMHESRPAEALTLIDRAIDVAGPHPSILDTRALIYLKSGKADRAIADLDSAIVQAPTAAMYFHLAQAHHLAKNDSAAATALRKGRETGLQTDSLHPLERVALQQLAAALNEKR